MSGRNRSRSVDFVITHFTVITCLRPSLTGDISDHVDSRRCRLNFEKASLSKDKLLVGIDDKILGTVVGTWIMAAGTIVQ